MSPRAHKRLTSCPTTRAQYDAIKACNWSTLREATRSALAYHHRLARPPADTDAMRLGRATHTAVFEPDLLLAEYVIWEGGRRAGKEWDEFAAMHAHRTILKADEYDRAIAIRDAVRAHKVAGRLLKTGAPECSITWRDRETKLACKARLDWLTPRAMVDLKTTRDIEARVFARHFGAMLYHGQMAFYAAGLAANGVEVPVLIIAVEQEAPHDVAVYELSEDVLWAGEVRVRQALNLVAECKRKRRWPGRYPEARQLVLPPWEMPSEDEELGLIMGGVAV